MSLGRPLWFVRFLKMCFPFRLLPAWATKLPVVGGIIDHWFFENDDVIFLPSNQVINLNKPIDMPDEMVLPSQVVEYFVEKSRYHWIMDVCMCRDAAGCSDYPVELGCLFLGEPTLGINPQLGRRVTKEEALAHVKRCREAGLVHMIGRNKLDTFWLGVGPGHNLLTICNCCPCCCLWRVLPHMASRISGRITRMPGVKVTVNEGCVGCGICTQNVCFVDAVHMTNGRAAISDACRGCGRCVSVCPENAIQIAVDDGRFVEKSIERLSQSVDVS